MERHSRRCSVWKKLLARLFNKKVNMGWNLFKIRLYVFSETLVLAGVDVVSRVLSCQNFCQNAKPKPQAAAADKTCKVQRDTMKETRDPSLPLSYPSCLPHQASLCLE